MSSGEKPDRLVTGIQNSATAIARGNLLIQNSVTDDQKCVLSTANAAKPYAVAMEASPGQDKPFLVAKTGHVKVKSGGTCTQGLYVESDASGLAVDATVGAGRNVFGRFLESGVSGDLVLIEVRCERITVSA